MQSSQSILLAAFTAAVLIFNTGCACLQGRSSFRYSESAAKNVFFAPSPDFENSAFISRWLDAKGEPDKIRYLLDRIGSSESLFIRNGRTHKGKTARLWFLYKLRHWVSGVRTAKDFVLRVASYSQKTGKPYLVQSTDGKIYPLGPILKNELSLFESNLARLNARSYGAAPPRPSAQVSLSPTAVATAAVATTTSS